MDSTIRGLDQQLAAWPPSELPNYLQIGFDPHEPDLNRVKVRPGQVTQVCDRWVILTLNGWCRPSIVLDPFGLAW